MNAFGFETSVAATRPLFPSGLRYLVVPLGSSRAQPLVPAPCLLPGARSILVKTCLSVFFLFTG